MRALLLAFLLISPVQLSESDRTVAELHQARVTLLQTQEALAACQITLQKASLTEEQTRLEKRFRDILHPADGDVFDWTSLTWKALTK